MAHSHSTQYVILYSILQHVADFRQVSYVHHVTPIPKDLDSNAAASILCAVRQCDYLY